MLKQKTQPKGFASEDDAIGLTFLEKKKLAIRGLKICENPKQKFLVKKNN